MLDAQQLFGHSAIAGDFLTQDDEIAKVLTNLKTFVLLTVSAGSLAMLVGFVGCFAAITESRLALLAVVIALCGISCSMSVMVSFYTQQQPQVRSTLKKIMEYEMIVDSKEEGIYMENHKKVNFNFYIPFFLLNFNINLCSRWTVVELKV